MAIAYLPPGWIGQNLFGYVQPMVVGYCVCCPESSETMLSDMREMGPTYFLAPPRVLEALLTQVTMRLEDAGGVKRALPPLHGARAARRRASARGRPSPSAIAYAADDLLIYGPLRDVLGMSRMRVAYTRATRSSPPC